MVQSLEWRLCQTINIMFNAIVETKHCVLKKQREQGLWDQVILVNIKKRDKTGGGGAKSVEFEYQGS